MYGIYTHMAIDGEEAVCLEDVVAPSSSTKNLDSSPFSWIWCVLLLHEYWVYLQHSNVLANPYCQRLDRQYGIALLKSNQHWAIAGEARSYYRNVVVLISSCASSPHLVISFYLVWQERYRRTGAVKVYPCSCVSLFYQATTTAATNRTLNIGSPIPWSIIPSRVGGYVKTPFDDIHRRLV
jgi:hypothetical protein